MSRSSKKHKSGWSDSMLSSRSCKRVERIRSSDLVGRNKSSVDRHDGDKMDHDCAVASVGNGAVQVALQAEQDATKLVEKTGMRTWEDNFKLLQVYKERFSHVCPPAHCPVFGYKFGSWVMLQVSLFCGRPLR